MSLYPLRFRPLLKHAIWGGRRLGERLGKEIGPESDYAESWEICDHGEDQSVILGGPMQGSTLHELVEKHGPALFGKHHPQPRFPLLFKFLDCNRVLSVQVHPDDEGGAKLDPPDLGKTECWVVLEADPGAVLYAGIKRGFDRAALEREISRGTLELCLHQVEAKPGDVIFIPAGLVHALGEGLLIAELQQSSDTTFRLFDWNRVGADGKPRELHIEQGLDATKLDLPPADPQDPKPTDQPHVQRLVECDKFLLDRWQIEEATPIGGDDRCHLLVVLEGSLLVEGDPIGEPLQRGDTALLPAEAGAVTLKPQGAVTLLDGYLP